MLVVPRLPGCRVNAKKTLNIPFAVKPFNYGINCIVLLFKYISVRITVCAIILT